MMKVFDSKVAVVTGAASGIGLETARQLCGAGSAVVGADIDAAGLERACGELASLRGKFTTMVVDVRDPGAIGRLVDGTVGTHGRIDYMFNNAGTGGKSGEVRDMTVEDWTRIVDVNLLSVVHGSTLAYAHMRKQGSGHIVNTASAAGLLGAPGAVPYGTTKAAVVAFSRDLRYEAEAFGVRVTALCPGLVESRIFENLLPGTIDVAKARAALPFKPIPTERAVTAMLRGVAANAPIVTLPRLVNLLWLLRRLFPNLMDRVLGRQAIRESRKFRLPEDSPLR